MKLTKIDSYEIQAFAFRVMTGYMAPGKDVSPLACEAPYEERCAAWEEWRNKHAHCILAMLHGFEALIDRNDEPTRALLADRDEREAALRAENESLRAALNAIARTPAMGFPDPGAHSARAYHEAVFVAWSRSNQTARIALAQAKEGA